jgi:ornithine lipid ester-linked acyl 2-hydroxylase
VEDQTYHWQPGRFFVFDDTCRYEVWNDSEEDRVILLLHARRPLARPGVGCSRPSTSSCA